MKAHEILTEGLSHNKADRILSAFVKFAANHIGLEELPTINFMKDTKRSVENKSFGGYGNGNINITITNRHINDVCRTLAHELVHFKQDINDELDDNSGDTGSPAENEANAEAAIIMRNWGKQHPGLFDQPAID